ncbi:oxidoreductase domain protein [Rhodovulum sulfidophilum]|uniref:Oxidoreductase domain protein n=1 Tax=Rhodovulum sulfidophilum TaxID=35806 RepID=A0A0D6B260_RHOSU|nr:oxidoreductase domain protein [Rhodovulum sulfidophilum]
MILPQLFWKLARPPDQRAIVIADPRHGDRGIVRHAIRGQTGRGDFGAAIIGIVKRDIGTGVLEAAVAEMAGAEETRKVFIITPIKCIN